MICMHVNKKKLSSRVPCLGAFKTKLHVAVGSICPSATTREPRNGFLFELILGNFTKIRLQCFILVKMGEK